MSSPLFLVALCGISLGEKIAISTADANINNNVIIDPKPTKPYWNLKTDLRNRTRFSFTEPRNVTWKDFIDILVNTSVMQLKNVQYNVNTFYGLPENELKATNEAFDITSDEYNRVIEVKLKNFIMYKKLNETDDNMLDVMDTSLFLLKKMIAYNLNKVNGQMNTLTKWYNETLKQKILRQQSKITTNYIETVVCDTLWICDERMKYSDYLIEWLRHFLSLRRDKLMKFFNVLPRLLHEQIYTVKSNVQFKKTIKFIVKADAALQRDMIDFIDEILTKKDIIPKLVPEYLKKAAMLLNYLFKVSDDNYDLNSENEDVLEDVSKSLTDWIANDGFDLKMVLDRIINNFEVNKIIWPLDAQNKIDLIWSQIITL